MNKKCILFLFLVLFMLIGTVSAENITENHDISLETNSNALNNINDKYNSDIIINEKNTTNDNSKLTSNTKTVTVNNYDELYNVFNKKSVNNSIINLKGKNYVAYNDLDINNSVNVTINFNNIFIENFNVNILNKSSVTFNTFNGSGNDYNIINYGKLVINNSNFYNRNNDYEMITNYQNLDIYNSKFYNSTSSFYNEYDSKYHHLYRSINFINSAGNSLKLVNNSFTNNGYNLDSYYNLYCVYSKDNKLSMTNNIFSNNKMGLIYFDEGSSNIINCNFTNNRNNGSYAITMSDTDLKIYNSTFGNNTGEYFIYLENGKLNLTNNSFKKNVNIRGFLYLDQVKTTITNCSFTNNQNNVTGIITSLNSSLKINKSTFTNNIAKVASCLFQDGNVTLTLTDNKFKNNKAYEGGALYVVYSKLEFTNNIFEENSATRYGGAMSMDMISGFINKTSSKQAYIINNTFVNNNASKGSVIYSRLSRINITNNVIVNNKTINQINGENNILNINGNWWGVNNPDFKTITNNIIPENWVILRLNSSGNKITLTFKLNANNKTVILPSSRTPYFTENKKTTKNSTFKSYNTFTYSDKNLSITLDNQALNLKSTKLDPVILADIITNPYNMEIKLSNNLDVNGTVKIIFDNQLIKSFKLSSSTYNYTYKFDDYTIGNHKITIQYDGNSKYNSYNFNYDVNIKDNNLNVKVTNKTRIHATITNEIIPKKYDPRVTGQVSPIKQQVGGTCGLFAAIGEVETTLLKFTGVTYDLAENYYKNMLGYDGIYLYYNPNEGISPLSIRALFARGVPFITEDMEPYSTNPFSLEYNTNYISIDSVNEGIKNREDREIIKELIYFYGPMLINYCSEYQYYNGSSYYYDEYSYGNHDAVVVGWDDSYSKDNFAITPPGNGAWIVKNSWGDDMGDNGFYYISYYTVTASYWSPFNINTLHSYLNIYGHDSLYFSYTQHTSQADYVKKVYTADNDELITAVNSFSDIVIKVNNQEVYKESKINKTEDLEIRHLNKNIAVNKGDLVEIILNNSDWVNRVDYAYTTLDQLNNPIVSYGQTFSSYDNQKTWVDTAEENLLYKIRVYTIPTPHINTKVTNKNNVLTITTSIDKQNAATKVSYKINGIYLKDSNSIINKTITNNVSFNYKLNTNAEYINLTTIIDNKDIIYEQTQLVKIEKPVNIFINSMNVINGKYVITTRVTDINNTLLNKGRVSYKLDGKWKGSIDVKNGSSWISFNTPPIGNHTIVATYINPNGIEISSDTYTFEKKAKVNVLFNAFNVRNGIVTIVNIVKDDNGNNINTGRISYTINGKWIGSIDVKKSSSWINFDYKNTVYTFKASYITNSNITQNIYTRTLNLSQVKSLTSSNYNMHIMINSMNVVNGKYVVTTKVTNDNYVKLNKGRISYTLDGKWIGSINVANSSSWISFNVPSIGKHVLVATYIDANGNQLASDTYTFEKKAKINVLFNAYNIKNGIVTIVNTVKDDNGNNINTGRISYTINGKWIGSIDVKKGSSWINFNYTNTKPLFKATYMTNNNVQQNIYNRTLKLEEISKLKTI